MLSVALLLLPHLHRSLGLVVRSDCNILALPVGLVQGVCILKWCMLWLAARGMGNILQASSFKRLHAKDFRVG
jgi:hypothetical protein